jgi:DNA repair protein RecO (recombination protein O)
MTHKTRGIVLRTVKFGETSLIVTVFTEGFGLQSYIVNGVRTATRKGPGRANLFQPASILDLVVYHHELKNLQRIREFKWGRLYQRLFFEVIRTSIALFMVELLLKCLKQPEPNPDLFHFTEDAFAGLDEAQGSVLANYPLFFALHLAFFFGLHISDEYSPDSQFLDWQQGLFIREAPAHGHYLESRESAVISDILKARHPEDLAETGLNQDTRRTLLAACMDFYALHLQDFGTLKSLPVLQSVFSGA